MAKQYYSDEENQRRLKEVHAARDNIIARNKARDAAPPTSLGATPPTGTERPLPQVQRRPSMAPNLQPTLAQQPMNAAPGITPPVASAGQSPFDAPRPTRTVQAAPPVAPVASSTSVGGSMSPAPSNPYSTQLGNSVNQQRQVAPPVVPMQPRAAGPAPDLGAARAGLRTAQTNLDFARQDRQDIERRLNTVDQIRAGNTLDATGYSPQEWQQLRAAGGNLDFSGFRTPRNGGMDPLPPMNPLNTERQYQAESGLRGSGQVQEVAPNTFRAIPSDAEISQRLVNQPDSAPKWARRGPMPAAPPEDNRTQQQRDIAAYRAQNNDLADFNRQQDYEAAARYSQRTGQAAPPFVPRESFGEFQERRGNEAFGREQVVRQGDMAERGQAIQQAQVANQAVAQIESQVADLRVKLAKALDDNNVAEAAALDKMIDSANAELVRAQQFRAIAMQGAVPQGNVAQTITPATSQVATNEPQATPPPLPSDGPRDPDMARRNVEVKINDNQRKAEAAKKALDKKAARLRSEKERLSRRSVPETRPEIGTGMGGRMVPTGGTRPWTPSDSDMKAFAELEAEFNEEQRAYEAMLAEIAQLEQQIASQ